MSLYCFLTILLWTGRLGIGMNGRIRIGIGGRFTQEYAVYTYTGITRPQQDFSKQSKAHLYA